MVLLERPLEPSGSGGSHFAGPLAAPATSPAPLQGRRPALIRPRRVLQGQPRSVEDIPDASPKCRYRAATRRGRRSVVRGWTFRGVGRSTLETGRLRRRALDHSRVHNRWGSPGGRGAEGPGYRRLEVSGADRLESGGHDPVRLESSGRRSGTATATAGTHATSPLPDATGSSSAPTTTRSPASPPRSTRRSGPLPRRDRPPAATSSPCWTSRRRVGWALDSSGPGLRHGSSTSTSAPGCGR